MLSAIRNWLGLRSTFARPEPWLSEAFGATETHAGIAVTAESALRSTAVFACIRVLSESVAGLPLHVYRRLDNGARERAVDFPLYRVLHDQPNDLQTSYEWRQLMMVWLLTHGNAYSEIVRDDAGYVTALWPLRPDRMRVTAEAGRITYQYTQPGGGTTPLPAERVLHIRGLSTDGVLGLSPIAAARQSIGLSLACEQFGAEYFGKGARIGGVLETPEKLGDKARDNLSRSWQETYAGPKNAHKVVVLEQGVKYNPFQFSAEDAQFIESRRFGVEDVARVYRCPLHKIAHLDKSSYSNIDALERAFAADSLMPWTINIEQAMSIKLLGPRQRQTHFIEHDINGLLRGDHEARMRAYQAGIYCGIYSPNEARKLENLPPREGGDVFLQPTNTAPSPYFPQQNGGNAA